MLEAAPKHLLSNDYVIRSSEGATTELELSSWRERAEFYMEGHEYRLYREGMVSGAFVLDRAGTVVARAEKPSAFSDTFRLEIGGAAYTLKRQGLFRSGFGVFAGGREVGAVAPAGAFTRRIEIRLPRDWPAPVQVFVFWLVLVIWNRDAADAE